MNNQQVLLEKNVACLTRDNITLRADIYRPNTPGTYPVLLTRIPYGKDDPYYSHRYLNTNQLVQAGYIVIIQDVRGRFHSEGEFLPFQHEAEDGYDTVEWAATLPYANGEVGMFGLSYYGFTQLLAAKEQPPHLRAIFPTQTLNDLREDMVYQNDVTKLSTMKTWILESMVPDLLVKKYAQSPIVLEEKTKLWTQAMNHLPDSFNDTYDDGWPLLEELGVAEDFFHIYDREKGDPLWEKTSIRQSFDNIMYPAIHLAGWYDCFLHSTLENYQQMQSEQHPLQRLIIGPWTHGDFGSFQGERDFGITASEQFLEGKETLTDLHIRWFDHWLKEKNTNVANEAPVKLFVMGINRWRDEAEWPLARTIYRPYYFHSDGEANSRWGDGKLSPHLPEAETKPNTFIHDANNPVPTVGGQTLYRGIQTYGPRDQQAVEERDDVLVYTTSGLVDAIEVTGPIKVTLWVASEAKEVTFTAKLVDVFPDGRSIQLADGISREIMTTSANGNKIEIDLWATSNVFLPGHAIRVEIASSSHPQFDLVKANRPNGEGLTQVKQYVYHDAAHPSHIMLPVIK